MKKLKLIFIFLTITLLTACATTVKYQESLNQWQGQNIQTLIKKWGYADSAIKLPNGDTVYMYYRRQLFTKPSYPTANPSFVSLGGPVVAPTFNTNVMNDTQTVSLYCQTWFETNANGTIINTRFAGNNCVANSPSSRAP